jgi:hypothetical protein
MLTLVFHIIILNYYVFTYIIIPDSILLVWLQIQHNGYHQWNSTNDEIDFF